MNRYRIDPKVLRDLSLAPVDVRDDDDTAELHRIERRDAGLHGGPLFDLFVRAGDSASKDGGITTDFVASTASIDRMGDVVEQSWRLAAWRSNPVILYEHAPPVVGRGTAKTPKGGNLTIKVKWDIGDHNPIGTLAGNQHLNGFRSAGSVGFMPGKVKSRLDLADDDPRKAPKGTPAWQAGHVFSHNELLEFSSVAVPANRDAVQLGLYAQDAGDDSDEAIRRFVDESVSNSLTAQILEAVKADPAIKSAILALVWGADPVPAKPAPEPAPHPMRHIFPSG